MASILGVGSGVAAASALDIIPTTSGDRKIATIILPGLLIPAAIFGTSAIIGQRRVNQCVSAATQWADVSVRQRKSSAEANAMAEAMRKEARDKAEAAERAKAEAAAQKAREEEEVQCTDEAMAAEQCVSEETRWPDILERQHEATAEANAMAEAMRKEARDKAEAAERAKAEAAAQKAKEEEKVRRAAEAKAAKETRIASTPEDRDPPLPSGTGPSNPTPKGTIASEAAVEPAPAPKAPSGYRSGEGYQKARWGMSRKEIKTLYPQAEPFESEGQSWIGFTGNVAGYKAYTAFAFAGDRLAVVTVTIANDRYNSADPLAEYDELLGLLTKLYGRPLSDEVLWKTEPLLGGRGRKLGAAIELGEAEKISKWERPDSQIFLFADGHGLEIRTRIIYKSRTIGVAADTERAKINDL
ncbi:hypothetical protein [Melittangium boletus]|uniref:hypothetical protein n=1 Tax=Melittangium boletus TaxID=83453 RepID=UPI000BB3A740|nr:hypothetical protein [Melittangium boletus]